MSTPCLRATGGRRSSPLLLLGVVVLMLYVGISAISEPPPGQTFVPIPQNHGKEKGFESTAVLTPHFENHPDCKASRDEFLKSEGKTDWEACGDDKYGQNKFIGLFVDPAGNVLIVIAFGIGTTFVLWTAFHRKKKQDLGDARAYRARHKNNEQ